MILTNLQPSLQPRVDPDCAVHLNDWWQSQLLNLVQEELFIENDQVRTALQKYLRPYFERLQKSTTVKDVSQFLDIIRYISVLQLSPLDDQDGLCVIA